MFLYHGMCSRFVFEGSLEFGHLASTPTSKTRQVPFTMTQPRPALLILSPSGECLLCAGGGALRARATRVGQLAANLLPIMVLKEGWRGGYFEMPLPADKETMCLLLHTLEGRQVMMGMFVSDNANTTRHGMVPVNSTVQLPEGSCSLELSDNATCTCSRRCRQAQIHTMAVACLKRLSESGCQEAERGPVQEITKRREPMGTMLSLLLAASIVDERARDPSLFVGRDVIGTHEAGSEADCEANYKDALAAFSSLKLLGLGDVKRLLSGMVGSLCAHPPSEIPNEGIVKVGGRAFLGYSFTTASALISEEGDAIVQRIRSLM